ncbi:hypothetical protein [Nonomuraea jabiensis]|uniref:hypothetical protein n=1 Tax=Nonomuraea jabiensis TaxID=882448 RepID=UPI003D756A2A
MPHRSSATVDQAPSSSSSGSAAWKCRRIRAPSSACMHSVPIRMWATSRAHGQSALSSAASIRAADPRAPSGSFAASAT